MAAGVIEARRDKPLDAQLAHIAERHRRPGGCLGVDAIAAISPPPNEARFPLR